MSDRESVAIRRLGQLQSAFAQLQSFAKTPIEDDRDRAGIIQAFEYTFELCWKTLQAVAQIEAISASGPKHALKAGFELGYVEDEDAWLAILDDRNLTTHTYDSTLAKQVCDRILAKHIPAIAAVLERLARESSRWGTL